MTMGRWRGEARKIAVAVGIALGAVLLVVAFVVGQEPSARPMAPRAPDPTTLAMAAPDELAPPTPAEETTPAETEAKTPARGPAETEAKTPDRPPAPAATKTKVRTPAARPQAAAPPPKRTRSPRRKPVVPPEKRMVSPSAVRGEGIKVKFKYLEALEALVEGDHVVVVLEYPDGERLLLPRELDGELVTLDVPTDAFQTWVDEGRVSELSPTPALHDRLRIHSERVRYLAVLSAELRDAIAREAERARVSVERSVMVIDAEQGHPAVSVLLARR